MPQTQTLTWATPTDYPDLADVMFDAVRNGPSLYSEAQRAAWVPERRGGAEWEARLGRQVIALRQGQDRAMRSASPAL